MEDEASTGDNTACSPLSFHIKLQPKRRKEQQWGLKQKDGSLFQSSSQRRSEHFCCNLCISSSSGRRGREDEAQQESDQNTYQASERSERQGETRVAFAAPTPPEHILKQHCSSGKFKDLKKTKQFFYILLKAGGLLQHSKLFLLYIEVSLMQKPKFKLLKKLKKGDKVEMQI